MFKVKCKFIVSILISLLLFVPVVNADELKQKDNEWRLAEEQWDLVKQGEQLLTMPVMQQVVDAWSSRPGDGIELRYPGGEDGELWVEELKDWLISLAIPSKYLFAVPSSGEADVIIIKITKVGDV